MYTMKTTLNAKGNWVGQIFRNGKPHGYVSNDTKTRLYCAEGYIRLCHDSGFSAPHTFKTEAGVVGVYKAFLILKRELDAEEVARLSAGHEYDDNGDLVTQEVTYV